MQVSAPETQSSGEGDFSAPRPVSRTPWRAFFTGACGVGFLCAITPYNDYRLHNTFLYGNHLPVGGLCLFAVLTLLINPFLRRRVPRWAFESGELILIWVMLTCGAGLVSSGLWRYLGPMVVAPAYFAGSGSRWLDGFASAPDWLLLTRDPKSDLAFWFYHRLPPGQPIPWAAWTQVAAAWGIAFGFMSSLSLGLAGLFRRQWVVRERLTFPLAQIPLYLVTDDRSAGFSARRRLLWAGGLMVFALHSLSTAPAFAPAIPSAPDIIDLSAWQQTAPWNALGLPALEVFFGVIGIIYLLPTDVSLTLWSTFVALHLFRVALGLIVLGIGGLLLWMHLAGISLLISALVVGLMGVILLVLARIMAESGLPFVMTPFIPTDLMAFWGTAYYTLPSATATLLTEVVLIHDPREHVMPAMTNAFALSGRFKIKPSAFTFGIALALFVGFVVSFYAFVGLNYRFGAVTLDAYGTDGAPHWSLDRALSYVRRPLSANAGDLQALASGGILAALFAVLKSKFLWWPFGPIGLAMGGTYAMNRIWFSVLAGWMCKALAVRVGGLRAYRLALPYFLGLILGEGVFAGLSILWGILTGAPTPQFLPN